jgi:hypothetical protein
MRVRQAVRLGDREQTRLAAWAVAQGAVCRRGDWVELAADAAKVTQSPRRRWKAGRTGHVIASATCLLDLEVVAVGGGLSRSSGRSRTLREHARLDLPARYALCRPRSVEGRPHRCGALIFAGVPLLERRLNSRGALGLAGCRRARSLAVLNRVSRTKHARMKPIGRTILAVKTSPSALTKSRRRIVYRREAC